MSENLEITLDEERMKLVLELDLDLDELVSIRDKINKILGEE